jgi:hypothetical protein
MKYLALFSFIILFIFVGCSKNNPTEPSVFSDAELLSKIVGTWGNEYLTIVYESNSNFQETIHFVAQDSAYSQSEIIKGTYTIKNGILIYNLTSWKILDFSSKHLMKSFNPMNNFHIYKINEFNSENNLSPYESIPNFKINFQEDLLYFYPLDILIPLSDNNDDIWGSWTTYQWAIGSGPNYQDSTILGKLEYRYNFNKDSIIVSFGSKFEIDSNGSYNYQTATVKYSPPNLDWGDYYHKTVEFHNGQMYMYEKLINTPMPLEKIK